jgi:hypothetical protein
MKLRMILEDKKDGRRKGRLLGQGFWEDVGVTRSNMDSPVASFEAVRMLLFCSGRVGEVIASGDISKAFLMADEYPEGSEPRYVRFRMHKGAEESVWRLKGPLYGSRDSPRLWYESFKRFMNALDTVTEMGFELDSTVSGPGNVLDLVTDRVSKYVQGVNDPCCFYNPTTGMRIALFVDDIISRGMPVDTEDFYSKLNAKYALRSWDILSEGSLLKHLGFTISEETVSGEVYRYMSQGDDVRRFLSDHNIELTDTVTCPMPDKDSIFKSEGEVLSGDELEMFKSMTGSLSWFGISLRYDICHSVSRTQQFSESPTRGALNAAIRIAAYVGSTSDFRVGGKVCSGVTKVEHYTDSDLGGDGRVTSRSHTGIMSLMNGVPVHWRSKKQPKTVYSPAHAEIYACSEGVREARWLQWVAADLGIDLNTVVNINVDNSQVISFKHGTCAKSRLRMIDLRWNWVKELKDDEIVSVSKVSTDRNFADILTKCLKSPDFVRQVRMISGREKNFRRGAGIKS